MIIYKILNAVLLLTTVATAQNYEIDWYVIASGGGHAESENYQADGTVGQGIVGQSSSDNYIVEAGFWVGIGAAGDDCVYIPGDCDYDNTPATLPDVIAMVGMYRGTVAHPYECDCPPHGDTFGATADPNGNCVADELPDVVAEIGIYRGTVEALGCEDCPGQGRLLPGENRPLVIPSLKAKVAKKTASNSR
jgi:hypothetical protein